MQASPTSNKFPTPETNKNTPHDEVMPSFPGGENALREYIKKNMKYPLAVLKAGIQGKVVIRFVVTETGAIEDVVIVRGLFPSCDAEAKRVVKEMPKWIPGKKDGQNVAVYYTIPFVFKIEKDPEDFINSIVYILEGKEISAEDLNNKFEKEISENESMFLSNCVLYDGKSFNKYGKTYDGYKVLEIIPQALVEKREIIEPIEEDNIVTVPDILASFPGGEKALINYLDEKVKYPSYAKRANIKGLVTIQFVVRNTGEITDITVVKGLDPSCNAEAVRVVSQMPKWIPGEVNGEKVSSIYRLPIRFKLK